MGIESPKLLSPFPIHRGEAQAQDIMLLEPDMNHLLQERTVHHRRNLQEQGLVPVMRSLQMQIEKPVLDRCQWQEAKHMPLFGLHIRLGLDDMTQLLNGL